MGQGMNEISSGSDGGIGGRSGGHRNFGGEPGDGVSGAFGGCLEDPDSIATIMEQRGAKIVAFDSMLWCPGATKGWLFVD
jgi:hypothetical protein